jgi:polyisoprenoid-binding protein YceI
MKRFFLILIAWYIFLPKIQGQIYLADSCRVTFFSAATIENISAENTTPILVMSATTGDIQISISNEGFIFKKKLMQEHFNEDYMESDKYPKTIFKGRVNEQVDYVKDGVNNVTVTGTMDMHGVNKTITIPGTITIKNGIIFLFAKFDAKLADYNIKIPTMLGKNIAEQVAITLKATMKPSKAK